MFKLNKYLTFSIFVVLLEIIVKVALQPMTDTEQLNDYPTCKAADNNLNECLRLSFQKMLPRLKNGDPQLNVPPIDPFVLEESVHQFDSGIAQGSLTLRNARVYGLSNTKFKKVSYELLKSNSDNNDDVVFNGKQKVRMQIMTQTPFLFIEGNYKVEMKLNNVKMTPKGYFNVTLANIQLDARPEGELYERNGHTYMHLYKFMSQGNASDMHFYASGMLPDPVINTLVLEFINQNWRDIYRSIMPEAQKSIEPFILNMANDMLNMIPIDLFILNN